MNQRAVAKLAASLSLAVVLLPNAPGAHLFGGPTFAFITAATYHDEGESEDVKNDLDGTTDVGLTVGGGVEFGRVGVDARYTWGLTSLVTDGDTGCVSEEPDLLCHGSRYALAPALSTKIIRKVRLL